MEKIIRIFSIKCLIVQNPLKNEQKSFRIEQNLDRNIQNHLEFEQNHL
ncbi:hypothetical protein [Bacillus sp. UNC41MFS5]|nr:hypothetical protein [Bacillus sp. UNC41MFS5]